MRRYTYALLGVIGILAVSISEVGAKAPQPPLAPQKPHAVPSPFGSREDPWYWLRDDTRKDPSMLAYLEAENAYTRKVLEPLAPLQKKLYEEIVGRLKQDDASVPAKHRGYWYYTRFETGKQYPIYARRKGELDAAEEILIDGNARAAGKSFYQLAALEVSDDGRWLAFAEDTVGRRQYTVHIKDLQTGEVLADTLQNVEAALAWAADDATLLYIRKDPTTLLGNKVYRHRRGTEAAQDQLVYAQDDDSFYLSVSRSKTDRFIFISAESTVSSEVRYADAQDPALHFQVVLPRERDHEYQVQDIGDRFVVRTNWQAKNFRIVEVPIGKESDRNAWRDVVPHRADAFVGHFDVFDDWLVVEERSGGLQKLRVKAWQGPREFLMDAADPAYVMGIGNNPETAGGSLRYTYSSPTTPTTTYDYAFESGVRELRKRDPVLGDFDPAHYVAEFRFVTARDGTRVPVSLLYRKGTKLDGSAPLYQYAYGSYGLTSEPSFRSGILSLVDRGFVYAIAHIRGGEEMGRAWYEDGKLQRKLNTFTDFIDVTRALVADKVADPTRVFGMGGSAGGLLMGAVANLAPQDYRALVAHVPFVDVVTTMLDESIPLTTNEFDEWGNPAAARETYEYMLAYSPYDNVKRQPYPALLVTSGLWDSQVQYWEPAKWVAKLRVSKTNDRPLLLRTNMEAGHGGKSGRFERYREVAEEYAFILWQAGISR
ncbi:MAG: S9 family peptidase [Gammaproteobacteria bacterium]|nr:S9 family peptidase [Gammaproteobacteria bacterium]